MQDFIDALERMTVLELVNLKKTLEERWGVSAYQPPVLPLHPVNDLPLIEEQTEFSVMLTHYGTDKIRVIKAVRELTDLGLREAKELVESAPVAVKQDLSREDAETAALKLRAANATVEIV